MSSDHLVIDKGLHLFHKAMTIRIFFIYKVFKAIRPCKYDRSFIQSKLLNSLSNASPFRTRETWIWNHQEIAIVVFFKHKQIPLDINRIMVIGNNVILFVLVINLRPCPTKIAPLVSELCSTCLTGFKVVDRPTASRASRESLIFELKT